MLARSHFHFGVMIGCSEQRMSRCNGQRRYWHDCRIQRFQHGTSSHAHINPQAVAASRFDPAYRRHEIFWARDFQHRRRVALPRHAHGRTSIAALTSTFCHNATSRQARKLRRSHAVSFVALSQNETRIRALRLRANKGQRSSFSRSSVSTVRGPAGWWTAPHHPALIPPAQADAIARNSAAGCTLNLASGSRLSQSGTLR
jgi:hypothetical protein